MVSLQAIFNDENMHYVWYQNGEYLNKRIYISGFPAIINRQGIREIISFHLNDNESNKFNKSANCLKENLNTYFLKVLSTLLLRFNLTMGQEMF